MNIKYLLLGGVLFLLGHLGVFHQLNGQFKWEWFKNNPHILALAGIPISLLYIYGTKFQFKDLMDYYGQQDSLDLVLE